jgi:4-amino-4-deoxy-L-arabinose transferase-like glycosyltransferase
MADVLLAPAAPAARVAATAQRRAAAVVLLSWALMTLAALAWRPLTPIDETRYAAVAWQMWLSGDPISLTLNGAPYADKPPLLFWLTTLGWRVVGPVAWWPQLLSALFALGTLALMVRLAQRLAPDRDDVAWTCALLMAASFYWMAFTGAFMFDSALSFFVVLAVSAVAWASRDGGWRAWALAGAAIGLGVLTKGPVTLLHVLPLALLAPWWRERVPHAAAHIGWGAWYRGIALAIVLAALIALAWAVPAAIAGDDALRREIFWSQSVDRIATTAHHWRPVWYYAATLPLLLFPWLCWPRTWRGIAATTRQVRAGNPPPSGLRFALAWALPVLLALSLFRGKQVQYLLPEVPAFAFVLACALAAALPAGDALRRTLRVACASVLLALGLYLGVVRALAPAYDTRPIGEHLAALQAAGAPIAHVGKYHGQFHFAGGLRQPLQVLHDARDVREWAARHPHGRIVVYSRAPPGPGPEFTHRYRTQRASIWRADEFARRADDWLQRNADSVP